MVGVLAQIMVTHAFFLIGLQTIGNLFQPRLSKPSLFVCKCRENQFIHLRFSGHENDPLLVNKRIRHLRGTVGPFNAHYLEQALANISLSGESNLTEKVFRR